MPISLTIKNVHEIAFMNRKKKRSDTIFCDDGQLSYDKSRTAIVERQGLTFDSSYRLAHLPLVAPDHPLVISTKLGTTYHSGIHELIYSIVIPVTIGELSASENFNKLINDVKLSKFTDKLSWDTYALRKNKLHATVCGSIFTGDSPGIENCIYEKLREMGPFSVSIRGLFSGNINVGRLYFKVYPELRAGKNICHIIQDLFRSPNTDLYVVGIFNLIEELDSAEVNDLKNILDRWWEIEIVNVQVENLWLLKSRDDLVLDGSIEEIIPLC